MTVQVRVHQVPGRSACGMQNHAVPFPNDPFTELLSLPLLQKRFNVLHQRRGFARFCEN